MFPSWGEMSVEMTRQKMVSTFRVNRRKLILDYIHELKWIETIDLLHLETSGFDRSYFVIFVL